MVEVIVNTSPLQYLHLLGQLELLPTPTQSAWMAVVAPADTAAVKRVARLGAGETEVLALGLGNRPRIHRACRRSSMTHPIPRPHQK